MPEHTQAVCHGPALLPRNRDLRNVLRLVRVQRQHRLHGQSLHGGHVQLHADHVQPIPALRQRGERLRAQWHLRLGFRLRAARLSHGLLLQRPVRVHGLPYRSALLRWNDVSRVLRQRQLLGRRGVHGRHVQSDGGLQSRAEQRQLYVRHDLRCTTGLPRVRIGY